MGYMGCTPFGIEVDCTQREKIDYPIVGQYILEITGERFVYDIVSISEIPKDAGRYIKTYRTLEFTLMCPVFHSMPLKYTRKEFPITFERWQNTGVGLTFYYSNGNYLSENYDAIISRIRETFPYSDYQNLVDKFNAEQDAKQKEWDDSFVQCKLGFYRTATIREYEIEIPDFTDDEMIFRVLSGFFEKMQFKRR